MHAVIHCNPKIPWQPKRAAYFVVGLRKAGITFEVTSDRFRHDEGFPILLGTTMWRDIERDGGEYLLVDRCSFGDTERFVSLVWNGHGRRGDHRVPANYNGERWERYGQSLKPWQGGDRIVLCGQTETYSPHYASLSAWYETIKATHFRPHPAGDNPTRLPVAHDFESCRLAVTLNSSVGVQCVLNGIPTVAMDEGAMAWNVSSHSPNDISTPERRDWANWLAWTQWTDDEIREGIPWAYHL